MPAPQTKKILSCNLVLLFLLLTAGLLLSAWFLLYRRLPVHDPVPAAIQDVEFLGSDLLAASDWAPFSRKAARGKETTTPIEIDGEQARLSRGWYANGRPEYEETYLNNRRHGTETWWDDRGQKILEKHWRNDRLDGKITKWYENGQMAEEATCDDGNLDGTSKSWFRSGQEATKVSYRKGRREGKFLAWHPNGKQSCEANFKDDFLDGQWRKWDEDGRLVKQVDYRNGAIVSENACTAERALRLSRPIGSR